MFSSPLNQCYLENTFNDKKLRNLVLGTVYMNVNEHCKSFKKYIVTVFPKFIFQNHSNLFYKAYFGNVQFIAGL